MIRGLEFLLKKIKTLLKKNGDKLKKKKKLGKLFIFLTLLIQEL
jgi:hypothetical protein